MNRHTGMGGGEEQKRNWQQRPETFALFGYERDGGRSSDLWKHPQAPFRASGHRKQQLNDMFYVWIQNHKLFTEDNVLKGTWIKVSDLGSSRKVELHADGTLTESEFVYPNETWEGTWDLVDGVLVMNIHDFILSVYAAGTGNLHSGVEFYEGEPYAYFKVIHLV